MSQPLFRQKSLERVSSPEQLNDYIHVANPGVWVVLGVIIVIFIGVFVWGVTGSLPSTISLQGMARDGQVVCYLSVEEAKSLSVGMEANVCDVRGRVTAIADHPISREDAQAVLDDGYVSYMLNLPEWSTQVTIAADGAEDGLAQVSVIAEAIRPIDFLLN